VALNAIPINHNTLSKSAKLANPPAEEEKASLFENASAPPKGSAVLGSGLGLVGAAGCGAALSIPLGGAGRGGGCLLFFGGRAGVGLLSSRPGCGGSGGPGDGVGAGEVEFAKGSQPKASDPG
jgi:hypothetical protein